MVYKEIEETNPPKHVKLSERKAILRDATLREITKVIYNGWLEDIQPSIKTYWPNRDELIPDNENLLS